MSAGIWNLLIGLAAIAAGASGQFHFIGTNSPTLLIVVGAVIAAFGAYQIVRAKKARG
jgi:hypothetical protein